MPGTYSMVLYSPIKILVGNDKGVTTIPRLRLSTPLEEVIPFGRWEQLLDNKQPGI